MYYLKAHFGSNMLEAKVSHICNNTLSCDQQYFSIFLSVLVDTYERKQALDVLPGTSCWELFITIYTMSKCWGLYHRVLWRPYDIQMFPSVFASKGYRPRSHGLTDALMKKHVRHHEAIPIG